MPIILVNKNGHQIPVKGESDAEFFERQRGGRITVEWLDGHGGSVQKDAIWATKVIPLDEHNKNVEAQKKAEEEKRAADEAARERHAKDALAKQQAAASEARKFGNRIKRLFKRG